MMTASEREAKELHYGAPGFSADTQRTTLQATVYSGDGCRRGDALLTLVAVITFLIFLPYVFEPLLGTP
jgi:hypothetical protein